MSIGKINRTWKGWESLTPVLRFANFYDAEPGGSFGPRYIQEHQILLVQAGRGWAQVGEHRLALEPGDVVFYGPNVRHEVRSDIVHPLRLVALVLVFRQEDDQVLPRDRHAGAEPFALPLGLMGCPLRPMPPVKIATGGTAFRRHCESLALSYISAPDGRPLEKRGTLLLLIEAWARAIEQERQAAGMAGPHRRAIEQAQQVILNQLTDPPGREELARAVGLSTDYFGRLFKQRTGLSVNQYVTHQRMLAARRLLVMGRLNVSEVAHAVGYGDPFYFSRLFTREFGVAASAYRSQHAMV